MLKMLVIVGCVVGIGNQVLAETLRRSRPPLSGVEGESRGSAGPQFDVLPTGNAMPTKSVFSIQATTQQEATREFLMNCGLVSDKGASQKSGAGPRDKVCGYFGVDAKAGTGDVWARNTLVTLEPGSGRYYAQGDEVDMNNILRPFSANVDDLSPFAVGVNVTGSGSFPITSAFMAGSANGTVLAHYAYYARPKSADVAAFYDKSEAPISLKVEGTHSFGVDTTDMTGNTALRMKAGQFVTAAPARKGGADVGLLAMDADNGVFIAGTGATSVAFGAPLILPSFGTPKSSTAACRKGQTQADAQFLYVCTADNRWRRVALSDF